MQKRNRVVLLFSGSSFLAGVIAGSFTLGWDEWQRLRLHNVSTTMQALSRPAAGAMSRAKGFSKQTPIVPPDVKAPRFQIVPLDSLPGGQTFTPVSLNDKGQVLGTITVHQPDPRFLQTVMRAVIYRGAGIEPLARLPNYTGLAPMAMNNKGQVVAIAYNPARSLPAPGTVRGPSAVTPLPPSLLQNRVVLCDAKGAHDLNIGELLSTQGVNSRVLDSVFRTRIGINDRADVTLHMDALYWWSQGQLHLVGTRMPLTVPLLPLCNAGVLVRPAARGAVYDTPTMATMAWYDVFTGHETPVESAEVLHMNSNGEVLCSDTPAAPQNLRTYRIVGRHGENRFVATTAGAGRSFVNDAGQVVGLGGRYPSLRLRSEQGLEQLRRQQGPFWCGDGRLYDLNDLISGQSGWLILQIQSFNNRGEMVVFAIREGLTLHTLLLRPVFPPPQDNARLKVVSSHLDRMNIK